MKKLFLFFCILLLSAVFSGLGWSADYPTKTITLIVSNTAGGSIDTLARGIAPYLEKKLNTTVLVQNLPGANGSIAYGKVFKSATDGYTLLAGAVPNMQVVELMADTSRYRSKEFIPVYAYARDGVVMAVHPEVFKNFEEFAKAARSRTLSVGMVGKGSPTHLGVLAVEKMLGVKFNLVPFDGGAPNVTTLAGKHIDAASSYTTSALSLIRAGKIRPLLIHSAERNQIIPDVPTPKELGYDSPSISTILGIFAPPHTPPEIIGTLERAFEQAVKDPKYVEWRKKMTSEFIQFGGRDFRSEMDKQSKLIETYIDALK